MTTPPTTHRHRTGPILAVISLAHSYGFSNLITPLLLHGIPLILAPAPLPEIVRQAAALAPHITLPAVPAMWRAWSDVEAIPAPQQPAPTVEIIRGDKRVYVVVG